MRILILILIIGNCLNVSSQTLGGNASFNFIQQSNAALLSALGGYNISTINNDVSVTFNNPALLRKEMHQQFSFSFNNFLAGIKNYSVSSAFYNHKYQTIISGGIHYFNYGVFTQTNAAGNILGQMQASDYALQISMCKQHKENWYIGATLKYLNSNYAAFQSNAIAVDVALNFLDTTKFFQAAFVVKNMGTQLKKYSSQSNKQELPFDVQLGITKRLPKAPFQFSLTAYHLQSGNILYNDTLYNLSEGNDAFKHKNYTAEKILSHLVIAAEIILNKQIQINTGYNFLRRFDLNVYNTANGLNGITMGLTLKLKKLHFNYATGFYQQNMFNQFSLKVGSLTK